MSGDRSSVAVRECGTCSRCRRARIDIQHMKGVLVEGSYNVEANCHPQQSSSWHAAQRHKAARGRIRLTKACARRVSSAISGEAHPILPSCHDQRLPEGEAPSRTSPISPRHQHDLSRAHRVSVKDNALDLLVDGLRDHLHKGACTQKIVGRGES